MAIRIDDEPEIVLTRAEYERLHREYQSTQTHTTAPVSFETWLRAQMARDENDRRQWFALQAVLAGAPQ